MRTAVLLIVGLLSLSVMAQENKDDAPGIKVGAKAPDFELKDQLDRKVKLSTLLKKGPVAVVFHRSASW